MKLILTLVILGCFGAGAWDAELFQTGDLTSKQACVAHMREFTNPKLSNRDIQRLCTWDQQCNLNETEEALLFEAGIFPQLKFFRSTVQEAIHPYSITLLANILNYRITYNKDLNLLHPAIIDPSTFGYSLVGMVQPFRL